MKRRSSHNEALRGVDDLEREVAALQAQLDEQRRQLEDQRRLEALSAALIGVLDRQSVLDLAQRVADDDELAHAAADRVASALDAISRIELQSDAIRTLERSLLPEALLPVPGLTVASRYLPAQGNHEVGGDFYDAIRTPDGGLTLIVGDVQGKGIEAATLTSLARHTLRASALAGDPPSELLAHLNRSLLYGQAEQLTAGKDPILRFVTAAVAHLEARSGDSGFDVTIARAGQPPPIIVRGDGRFEAIEPRGVLLGVSNTPTFEEIRCALDVGDTLVLYTDGVIEQRGGEGKAMTEQHLAMLVRNRRGVVDAEAIADLIEATVRLVAPEAVRDDVAVLVACPTR
jgi:serine phosphatase RsbU (regulator of sigma subunit)